MIKKLLHRIRGLVGFGLTWGGLWGVIGAGIGVIVGMVRPEAWTFGNPIVEWAVGMGLYGFVSGIGFGGFLAAGEGHRTLKELSLRRVALWGVLGSAAVPLFFGVLGMFDPGTTTADILGAMLVTSALGGTFAPGAVAIARRGELSSGSEPRLDLIGEQPGRLRG